MSNITSFAFPLGTIVSVITVSEIVFIGTVLGLRQQGDCNELGAQFLFIQLTTAVSPYSVGEIVAINFPQIISIGPIISL